MLTSQQKAKIITAAIDDLDATPDEVLRKLSIQKLAPSDLQCAVRLIEHARSNIHLSDDEIMETFQPPKGKGSRKVRDLSEWLSNTSTFTARVSNVLSWIDAPSGEGIVTHVHPIIAEFRIKHFGGPEKHLTFEEAVAWLDAAGTELEMRNLAAKYAVLSHAHAPYMLDSARPIHFELSQAANAICRSDGLTSTTESMLEHEAKFRWTVEEAAGYILCGLVPRLDPIETYVLQDYFAPGLDAVVLVASPHEEVRNASDAWRDAADIRLGRHDAQTQRDLHTRADELRAVANEIYASPSEDEEEKTPGMRQQRERMHQHLHDQAAVLDKRGETTFPRKMSFRTEMMLLMLQRMPHLSREEQMRQINNAFPERYRFKSLNTFEKAISTALKGMPAIEKRTILLPPGAPESRKMVPYTELEQWWENPSHLTRIICETMGQYPPHSFRRVGRL